MKRFVTLLLSVVAVFIFVSCGEDNSKSEFELERARQEAYQNGYEAGYEQGQANTSEEYSQEEVAILQKKAMYFGIVTGYMAKKANQPFPFSERDVIDIIENNDLLLADEDFPFEDSERIYDEIDKYLGF